MEFSTLLSLISYILITGLAVVSHVKGSGKADKSVVDKLLEKLQILQKNDIQLQRALNEKEIQNKSLVDENNEQEREIAELRNLLTENNPEMQQTLLTLSKGMNYIMDRLEGVEVEQVPLNEEVANNEADQSN